MNPLMIRQHSSEWLDIRRGKCTGSRVADALSFLKRGEKKGKSSEARKKYMIELVSERLTGLSAEHYVSREMEWGIENEKYARAAYEAVSGFEVDLVGIAVHPTIEGFAASPDGFIGDSGVFEAKCPTTANHLAYLLDGEVPEEYLPQCYAELACSGRDWLDFMSFDPRLPVRQRVFIKRLYRNEERIAELEAGVTAFLAEVEAMMVQLDGVVYVPPPKESTAVDESLGIQDEDLPRWYQEMKEDAALKQQLKDSLEAE